MGDVVPFATGLRTANDEPHLSGKAVCLCCGHRWVAVCPVGAARGFECPACHLMRGELAGSVHLDNEDHWECACGCDLFKITMARVYCPNCGRDHRPFDEPRPTG